MWEKRLLPVHLLLLLPRRKSGGEMGTFFSSAAIVRKPRQAEIFRGKWISDFVHELKHKPMPCYTGKGQHTESSFFCPTDHLYTVRGHHQYYEQLIVGSSPLLSSRGILLLFREWDLMNPYMAVVEEGKWPVVGGSNQRDQASLPSLSLPNAPPQQDPTFKEERTTGNKNIQWLCYCEIIF